MSRHGGGVAKTPAGRVRSDLRMALAAETPEAAARQLGYARRRMNYYRDVLAIVEGLSEAVEGAFAAGQDAMLDQGESTALMQIRARIAIAILDEEVEKRRPTTTMINGRTFRLVEVETPEEGEQS